MRALALVEGGRFGAQLARARRRHLQDAHPEVRHQPGIPLIAHDHSFHGDLCHVNVNSIIVRRSSAAALKASDQWMPIRLPPRPTVTPLKARSPRLAMANRPMTRPRTSEGACTCTRG